MALFAAGFVVVFVVAPTLLAWAICDWLRVRRLAWCVAVWAACIFGVWQYYQLPRSETAIGYIETHPPPQWEAPNAPPPPSFIVR